MPPATTSERVLGGLLRGKLGYEGLVITDDLEMKAIADHYPLDEAVVRPAAQEAVLAMIMKKEMTGGAGAGVMRETSPRNTT